jgi:fructose-1,6-bisphosphatase I
MVAAKEQGKFLIAFDPLDGSSNIDCNVTVGTIFAIWLKDPSTGKATQKDFFQTGRQIFAAGYCIYGTATQFILAFNNEVNLFTQGDNLGDFILTHPKIRVKDSFNVYSINEGNEKKWHPPVKEFIKDKKHPEKGKTAYSLRYIGSMVGDVHRTLLYGGIFMYPADTASPKGKLRVLYECIPLSYVMECAGGLAHDGENDILDILPNNIHQRTGIIMGSKHDVEECRQYHKKFGGQPAPGVTAGGQPPKEEKKPEEPKA